jgi:hypothetical protein
MFDLDPNPDPACITVPVPLMQKVAVPAFIGSSSTTPGIQILNDLRRMIWIQNKSFWIGSKTLKVINAKKWPTVFGPLHETKNKESFMPEHALDTES